MENRKWIMGLTLFCQPLSIFLRFKRDRLPISFLFASISYKSNEAQRFAGLHLSNLSRLVFAGHVIMEGQRGLVCLIVS